MENANEKVATLKGSYEVRASLARGLGIRVLRADHENRTPGNQFRAVTAHDILMANQRNFYMGEGV